MAGNIHVDGLGLPIRRVDSHPSRYILRWSDTTFLRATAATAVARLSHRNSVSPSVRRWISQKRCKLGSLNFQRRLGGRL